MSDITLADVEKQIASLLAKQFPGMKFYDNAVIERLKRPCMILQWRPVKLGPSNYNTRQNKVVMYITYYQTVKDDADTLDKVQQIRDLFGLYIKVGDRAVDTGDIDFNYIGSERNIPQISIDFCWSDKIKHPDDAPLMEYIEDSYNLIEDP